MLLLSQNLEVALVFQRVELLLDFARGFVDESVVNCVASADTLFDLNQLQRHARAQLVQAHRDLGVLLAVLVVVRKLNLAAW